VQSDLKTQSKTASQTRVQPSLDAPALLAPSQLCPPPFAARCSGTGDKASRARARAAIDADLGVRDASLGSVT